jgi:uncharacterized FlaG/YvyC family protein
MNSAPVSVPYVKRKVNKRARKVERWTQEEFDEARRWAKEASEAIKWECADNIRGSSMTRHSRNGQTKEKTMFNETEDTKTRKRQRGAPEATYLTPDKLRTMIKKPIGTMLNFTVDKAIADYILEFHNAGNSRVRQSSVDQYKGDLLSGMWFWVGECLGFDVNGDMVGGQHRLMAISETGVETVLPFAFGCEPEARSRRNSGKRDKPSDYLATAGYEYTTTLAGVIRWLYLYEASVNGTYTRDTFAPPLYPALAKKYNIESIYRCIRVANVIHGIVGSIPTPYIAVVYYLARTINEGSADSFFEAWAAGTPEPVARKAQKVFTAWEAESENKSGKDWNKFVALIHMWNNWISNERCSIAKIKSWNVDQPVPELLG